MNEIYFTVSTPLSFTVCLPQKKLTKWFNGRRARRSYDFLRSEPVQVQSLAAVMTVPAESTSRLRMNGRLQNVRHLHAHLRRCLPAVLKAPVDEEVFALRLRALLRVRRCCVCYRRG
jgi:hypothetical protein